MKDYILKILGNQKFDRVIALIAVIPFFYEAYQKSKTATSGSLNAVDIVNTLVALVFFGTMMFRRAPVRVTTNPFYWILAFVATYQLIWYPNSFEKDPGLPLISNVIFFVLALTGGFISLFARFNLGRNIGFVPAQRELVMNGLYGYMRHPIYTGIILSTLSSLLANFSYGRLGYFLVSTILFVVKTFVEENFLSQDPAYAKYMTQVRYRWIPKVI